MTTIRITRKKRPDPFRQEIDACKARRASKRAASKREPVPAPVTGPAALYALASFIRASAVNALGMGER